MQRYLFILLVSFAALRHAQAETLVERGHYLVEVLAACGNCHTPRDGHGPLPGHHLGGGRKFEEGFGVAFAPNLTPDPETGLGAWSNAQVIQAISRIRPDGRVLLPPMPWPHYAGNIRTPDLQALLTYLRSLPPIVNKVPPPVPPRQ